MSRSKYSELRAKTSAGQRLASLYGKYFHISAVTTTSLRFSEKPEKWSIEAVPTEHHEKTFSDHITLSVEITATLPKVWCHRRTEPRPLLNSFIAHQLVAGTSKPLPPPPGEECTVRMIAFAAPVGASIYHLTPRWGFLIAGHGIEALCGVSDQPPGDTAKAIALAYCEFREHLAAKVAERLLPKPKAGRAFVDELAKWGQAWSNTTTYHRRP